MSSRDVVGLIPDRDSDSSDDEFLDALEKIENEPDELGPENGSGMIISLTFSSIKVCSIITLHFSGEAEYR